MEIGQKFRTTCQDCQAEESAVKSFFQRHNRMVRMDFEPRSCRSQSRHPNHWITLPIISEVQANIKARFHYERGKDYSLFVLLNFFALLSAHFNFKRGKINKRNKECSFPRLQWKWAFKLINIRLNFLINILLLSCTFLEF